MGLNLVRLLVSRSAGQNYLDDLVMLDKISEDRIMEVLKNRYMQDSIYVRLLYF